MADETRQVIIDVEIEDKDFDQEIASVNKQLRENREEIKELSKDYEENAEAIAKLEAENRDLSASKRQLIKESQTEANSINALRQRVAQLTKERNNLDLSTQEGKDRLEELNAELLENVTVLREAEEAGGDFRRNVGNYTQGLKEAAGGITVFGTNLNQLSQLLLKNPIGLLVAALTSLVALFSRSQTGIEFFQRSAAVLSTVLGKLSDIIERLGGNLIAAFEDPQQAIKDFGTLIVENIINRFNAALRISEKVRSFFSTLFSEGLGEARKELNGLGEDVLTSITGVENLGQAILDFASDVSEAVEQASALEQSLIDVNKAIADQEVQVAQSIRNQKELNLLIEDLNASTEDRIAAAEEFARVEQEQIERSVELARERLKILRAQNDLTNSTEEDIQRVRDAEIELANLEAASFERRVTNQNKLNTILNQQQAERQKELDEFRKAEEEFAAQQVKDAERRAREDLKRTQEVNRLKIQAEQQFFTSTTQIFEQGTAASKAFALAQIAFDTGKAISALTAASEGNPANAFTFGGAGVAQFVAGLARITANIAQAKRILSSGTSSNSLSSSSSLGGGGANAIGASQELSNVNASLLSQFGDGARQNQETNDAINNAISNQPAPQVAVVDINTAQNRREVKVTESQLG